MKSGFLTIDWLILILYFALIVGKGLFLSRRAKTFSGFLFGGSNIPWWAIGLSLIATSMSSTSYLGLPEYSYRGNLALLMYQFGAFIAILITIKYFIPMIRSSGARSAYEILEKNFDSKTRLLASCIYCLHVLLRLGVLLYGPALVLSPILGISTGAAICLMGTTAILYTYIGGIEAVVWTDVSQFAVMFLGVGIILYFATMQGNSLGELFNYASAQGHTRVFNFEWNLMKADNFWTLGLAIIVLEVSVRASDQQFVQRYLSCKDIQAAQRSSFLSWAMGCLLTALLLYVGTIIFGFYGLNPEQLPSDTPMNKVFPHFILMQVPAGITGLLVAALFAAAMSSLDSALTALSNTVAVDFIPKVFPHTNDQSALVWAKRSIWFFGLIGIGAGLVVSATKVDLFSTALIFTSLFIGPLLGLFILVILPLRVSGNAAFTGALFGVLCLLPFKPELWQWMVGGVTLPSFMQLAWPIFPVISCGVTVLVSLLFKRPANART